MNDVDTGLVYMQQRYYDPIAGRFLSVDPVTTNAGDGSFFNRYVYTNNNPYKFKDPDGRAPGSFDCDCSGGTTNAGLPVSPIVTLQILAIQNGVSPAAVQAVTAIATAAVTRGGGAKANSANATAGTGRGANKLGPVKEAQGAHSTFKTDADGKVTNTATYTPNPKNPSGHDEVKRVDVTGTAHTNSDGTKVPTPHVHEAGQKDVRPARPEEQPK